jgi:hypothetical protein
LKRSDGVGGFFSLVVNGFPAWKLTFRHGWPSASTKVFCKHCCGQDQGNVQLPPLHIGCHRIICQGYMLTGERLQEGVVSLLAMPMVSVSTVLKPGMNQASPPPLSTRSRALLCILKPQVTPALDRLRTAGRGAGKHSGFVAGATAHRPPSREGLSASNFASHAPYGSPKTPRMPFKIQGPQAADSISKPVVLFIHTLMTAFFPNLSASKSARASMATDHPSPRHADNPAPSSRPPHSTA